MGAAVGIGNSTTSTLADESSDTTCFPVFATGATGDLALKTGSNLTFNASNGQLTATSFAGDGSNLTGVSSSKILQLLSTVKTDQQSFTISNSGQYGSTLGTISNFSQAITITNNAHKVLVQGFISLGSSYSGNTSIGVSLERGGAQISGAIGDADGSRKRQMYSAHVPSGARGATPFYFSYLDTPSSGTHTYTIELEHLYAAVGTIYVNRGNSSDNNIYNTVGISVMTVMEVAA